MFKNGDKIVYIGDGTGNLEKNKIYTFDRYYYDKNKFLYIKEYNCFYFTNDFRKAEEKETQMFKDGDKIKCIAEDDGNNLQLGKIYTFKKWAGSNWFYIYEFGFEFEAKYFEKANEMKNLVKGDLVMCIDDVGTYCNLVKGTVYTFREYNNGLDDIIVEGVGASYMTQRFKKVTEVPEKFFIISSSSGLIGSFKTEAEVLEFVNGWKENDEGISILKHVRDLKKVSVTNTHWE